MMQRSLSSLIMVFCELSVNWDMQVMAWLGLSDGGGNSLNLHLLCFCLVTQ